MYKVFVNDKPIILTDSLKNQNDYPVFIFRDMVFEELMYRLKKGTVKGVNLFSVDLEGAWEKFKTYFKVIVAGGGLVLNDNDEALFIYRGNKWDLPKGRTEANEDIETTAIREVEEECGIDELELKDFLITTYHIFYQDNENRLKETHWYLMNSNYKGELKPQIEEGITDVVFKNETEAKEALQNTYANIKLVYETYKKVKSI